MGGVNRRLYFSKIIKIWRYTKMALELTKSTIVKIVNQNSVPGGVVVSRTIAAIDAGDDYAYIDAPYDSRILVRVTCTSDAGGTVTIKGRHGTDSDLVLEMVKNDVVQFTIENSEFMNFNLDDKIVDAEAKQRFGRIYFTVSTGMTGNIEVYEIPK